MNPGRTLLRLGSSVWSGVFLLSLLFIYSSVGSAMPWLRQKAFFEKTEFEWFHWWPFYLLIALICLNVTIATLRRIPLKPVHYGVWMIHAGILTLCAGSAYYFGTKVEGDTPVFRRWIRMSDAGAVEGVVALPGNQKRFEGSNFKYTVEVQGTNSDYTLLTGEDKGKKTFAVTCLVQRSDGITFARQLLEGYPQYTEDVIPGKGRAVKELGRPLVDEELSLSLELEPQDRFWVRDAAALCARSAGSRTWLEATIDGLPHYNEYIAARDWVFLEDAETPIRPLDLPVRFDAHAAELDGARFHVTGYLPYAHMEDRWFEGGATPNPVLTFDLLVGNNRSTFDLVALDPTRNTAQSGFIEFRSVPDEAALEDLPRDHLPTLTFLDRDTKAFSQAPITPESVVGQDGPYTRLEGSELSYRVVRVVEDLVLADGREVSLAQLDLKKGDRVWSRAVATIPEMTRDAPMGMWDPHGASFEPPDPNIVTTLEGSTAALIFAGLPDGRLFIVWNGDATERFRRFAELGERILLAPQIAVQPIHLIQRGVRQVRPYVVPKEQRQSDTGGWYSMIRLEMTDRNGQSASQWIPFSRYAFADESYNQSGRFLLRPAIFQTSTGRRVEVAYSRPSAPLPAPVALQEFNLETRVGGYSGAMDSIRNYVSRVRFWEGGRYGEPRRLAVNEPTEHGGFWFFQSEWDRPEEAEQADGMKFTILGVGNRNGVGIMLGGCILAVIGMIYAFYVKPRLVHGLRKKRAGQTMTTESAAEAELEVAGR